MRNRITVRSLDARALILILESSRAPFPRRQSSRSVHSPTWTHPATWSVHAVQQRLHEPSAFCPRPRARGARPRAPFVAVAFSLSSSSAYLAPGHGECAEQNPRARPVHVAGGVRPPITRAGGGAGAVHARTKPCLDPLPIRSPRDAPERSFEVGHSA